MRQASLGLQHAHDLNLVHRDIKPANLMLEYSGSVKILDLGLGKFFSEQRSDDSRVMTRIGATMGTPDYMSPEQCQVAKDVDIRSDIYSLGCTFCYLATGHPLYHEEQFDTPDKKMMGHIVGQIPRLADEIPETPPELEEIFQKMLAKKREDRFQTPEELADVLEPFADHQELRELIEAWKHEHGIVTDGPNSARSQGQISSGRSTGRVSAKSTKKHFARHKTGRQTLPHLARDWRVIILVSLILVGAAALLPFLLNEKKNSPELQQARLELAQLPGLNGRWWFEEIPWFLPPVREQLMRKVDKTPGLLEENLKKYSDPNVAAVYDWLRGITQEHLIKELTVPQQELVAALMKFSDPKNADTDIEETLGAALKKFVTAHENDDWNAVDMHTRANLMHRIAAKAENAKQAEDAVQCYAEAAALYEKELQTAERLYPLAVLCEADGLRIEYALVAKQAENNDVEADYGALFDQFREVCLTDRDRPIGGLFEVEFRTMFGAYCAEAGEFKEAIKQFSLANTALGRCGIENRSAHPLTAHIAERHGWSLMDLWRVAEARQLFADAWRYRKNYKDIDKSQTNYTVDYYVLHNRHALAMALRYVGDSENAEKSYAAVQEEIDALIEKFKRDPQSEIFDRQILSNLNERAGNTRERRADCIFYSGAASGVGRERFAEMVELYCKAGEFYEPTGMKRVMRLKQAIMLMLIGGERFAEGNDILKQVIAEEQEKPLSGNQVRYQLMRQLAEAVAVLKNEDETPAAEKRRPLENFLKRFHDSGSDPATKPISQVEAARRENQEMRLFAVELLLGDLLANGENIQATRDLVYLDTALVVFRNNPEIQAFKKRFDDLAARIRELPITGNE